MRIKLHPSQSGIALMTVLIVMAVFIALSFVFAYHIKMEVKLARNSSFDPEFEWMGRSGVELARYVLANDGLGPGGGQIDSKMNKWAGGPGDTNGVLAGLDLSNYEIRNSDGTVQGTISLKIVDQDSKFNINAADGGVLDHALGILIGIDASETPAIRDSIMDWKENQRNPRPNGAKSDHYKTLDPPYFAKEAPIDDLTELLMVKGVTSAMFWGSGAGSRSSQVFLREKSQRSHFEEPIYAVGLNDLFTPLSSRLVNVNTASAAVLQMLVDPATGIAPIDETIAEAIIHGSAGIPGRAGIDGQEGTADDQPYRSPQEVQRVVGPNPLVMGVITRYCSVRSLVFEVTATVSAAGQTRTYIAMVRRNQRDIQVLNFYWK